MFFYITQIYVFLVLFTIFHFDLEKFISKNCKYIYFSTRNLYIFGENTSIYCSLTIAVHVYATFFLKFTQCVTLLQTVSNQEVTLKRLISILQIAQKLYIGA